MARKRYSDEDVLNLLRQIELSLASGSSVETACRSAGVSDATYYNWRKRYGGWQIEHHCEQAETHRRQAEPDNAFHRSRHKERDGNDHNYERIEHGCSLLIPRRRRSPKHWVPY